MLDETALDGYLPTVCQSLKIESLYSHQRECVYSLLAGKDVFASLPTGYGKSMIFQVLPSLARSVSSRSSRRIFSILRKQDGQTVAGLQSRPPSGC
eukprot:m.196173 g.196173  ORF g.196173 m.196173 type:complete len:96 (+) comp39530_c0_seq16:127-414(+)